MPLTVPTRVCLSGEDLDWLGGYSVCAAIELSTLIVEVTHDKWRRHHHRFLLRDIESFLLARHAIPQIEPSYLVAICRAPSPGGLGTSSSVCLGLISEVLRRHGADSSAAVPLAYEFEFERTRGGGMDHLSIARGGWMYTLGRDGSLPLVKGCLSSPRTSDWRVTLVNTNVDKDCGAHITDLRLRRKRDPEFMLRYVEDVNQVSRRAWDALVEHSLAGVQSALEEAHALMRDRLDATTPAIEKLRRRISAATGYAFKITGSGGGGCIFTIHERQNSEDIRESLVGAGVAPTSIFQCGIANGMEIT